MIQVRIADMGEKKNIGTKESKMLYDFCMENSRRIVLARRHQEKVDDALLEELKNVKIRETEKKRRQQLTYIDSAKDKELKADGFLSRQQALEVVETASAAAIEEYRRYEPSMFDGKDTLEEDLKAFGLERREITIDSFTSQGLWDLCYFGKDSLDLRILEQNLFYYPIRIGKYGFEDIAFEDETGKVWARVCSHDRELVMDMDEVQYEKFKALKIKHRTYPKQKMKPARKAAMISVISAASVVGAALGITLGARAYQKRKKRLTEEKEEA